MPRPPASPEDFKPIAITEGVTIKELAEKMDIKSKYIIQKLISKGILASINQALDLDAAKEVCAEFGFRADVISFEQEAEAKQEVADNPRIMCRGRPWSPSWATWIMAKHLCWMRFAKPM